MVRCFPSPETPVGREQNNEQDPYEQDRTRAGFRLWRIHDALIRGKRRDDSSLLLFTRCWDLLSAAREGDGKPSRSPLKLQGIPAQQMRTLAVLQLDPIVEKANPSRP